MVMRNDVRDVICFVAGIIIVMVGGTISLHSLFESETKANNMHRAQQFKEDGSNKIVLTPRILKLIFEDNSVKERFFENKSVLIHGTILRKDRDIADYSYLELKIGNMSNIGCYFENEPKDFSTFRYGQSVTISGIFKGVIFDSIIISESQIVESDL